MCRGRVVKWLSGSEHWIQVLVVESLFFCLLQICAEFKRITTVPLVATFTSGLDKHTPKLLSLFRAKGGAAARKMKTSLEGLDQVSFHSFSLV